MVSVHRPRRLAVLLSLPSLAAPEWFTRSLGEDLEVTEAIGFGPAFDALSKRSFDLVIGQWTPRWSKWISTHAPAPSFLHVGPSTESLLAAAARGLPVHACADQPAFLTALKAVVGREREARRMAAPFVIEASLDGLNGTLHDFAHSGLSVLVPFGSPLSKFACDQVLTASLRVDGHAVLAPTLLRTTRVRSTDKGYLIAGSFVEETKAAAEREITEPTRIEALISTALNGSGLQVESYDDANARGVMRGGDVDVERGTLTAAGAEPALPLNALVEVEFEAAAARLAFTSVVLSTSPLTLKLPRRLTAHERRVTERRASPPGAILHFDHPLLGTKVTVPVVDFAPDGLGLELPADAAAMPVGLVLRDAQLSLGGRIFEVSGSVRRLTRLAGGTWHCGVALTVDGTDGGVARLWVQAEFPELELGTDANPSELMQLFQKTGTAPPNVNAHHATTVLAALHRAPTSLYRSVVFRRGGEIVAHAGAIRRYRSLWTVQHLTSAHPDRRVPFSLLRAGIELCMSESTAGFVHGNYAVDNLWSARAMGSGLSGVDGAGRWALPLRQFTFLPKSLDLPCPSRVTVRAPQSVDEQLRGEAIIAAQEAPLLMQAFEWQAAQWPLDGFSQEWRDAGLDRTRSALVALVDGVVAGIALVECSTRSLNLREDLSAARLWVDPALSSADRRDVFQGLVVETGRWYGQQEFDVWPLIVTPNEEDAWLDGYSLMAAVRFVEATTRRDAVHALSRIWASMAGSGRTPTEPS